MYIEIQVQDLHLWHSKLQYYGFLFYFTNTMNLLALAYNNSYLNHNWDFIIGKCRIHRFKCGSKKLKTKTIII